MKITYEQVSISNLFHKKRTSNIVYLLHRDSFQYPISITLPLWHVQTESAVTLITSKSLKVLNFPSSTKKAFRNVKS